MVIRMTNNQEIRAIARRKRYRRGRFANRPYNTERSPPKFFVDFRQDLSFAVDFRQCFN